MKRIRLHEAAFQDMNEISASIGQDSPRASVHFLEAAQDAFDRIAEMPGSGIVVENRQGRRCFRCVGYNAAPPRARIRFRLGA